MWDKDNLGNANFGILLQFPSPAPIIVMTDLHQKNCIPCRGEIPPFDISEIHKYLKKIDGWDVKKNKDEIYYLEKNFNFKNFSESQKFVNLKFFSRK